MRQWKVIVGAALSVFGAIGCAGMKGTHAVPAASAEAKASLLGTVEKFAGSWESQGEDGQWHAHGTFTPGSGGSAVREVMMPGTPHEMTNMYTMEGGSVCMVHYCAMGNQPRMRCTGAVRGADGSVSLPFEPDSVTDLHSADEAYMGKMTLTLHSDGTGTEEWWQVKQGKVTGEHHMVFKLRKKG
ncbi:MAG: hypothetical protein U0637_00485 [Phycisphaerales bacterium]